MRLNAQPLLVSAGLVNIIGILALSLFFTNRSLTENSPIIFSQFGLVCIILWGVAYIVASMVNRPAPFLCVFAVEKLVYVISWIIWVSEHGTHIPEIFNQSYLTGIFYSVYGLIDLGFGIAFALTAYHITRENSKLP